MTILRIASSVYIGFFQAGGLYTFSPTPKCRCRYGNTHVILIKGVFLGGGNTRSREGTVEENARRDR